MELPKSNDSGGSTDATQQRPGNAVIIIGAGAAGLMAAYALSAAGVETILLEAADAPGGRIRTLHGNGFTRPVEAGAEFVHGDLPLTLRLLKEAGIPFHKVGGKMISVNKGVWGGQLFLHDQWDQLMVQMSKLKKDLPLAEFLSAFFGGEKYAALRDSVERYAGGFDLADPRIASTLALYKEWNAEDGHQHRIDGGYERLINYLADQCRGAGCALHFSAPVKKIEWARGRVVITTAGGMVFTGGKVIITVSVGVLQLSAGVDADGAASGVGPVMDGEGSAAVLRSGAAIDETGSATAAPASVAIQFLPAIPDHLRAAGQLGYGTVTKFLVEFRQPFWNKRQKDLGFIVSDEAVPTWWTQAPDEYPLLTGWLPGALQARSGDMPEGELANRCLNSLASIFSMTLAELKAELVAVHITDWSVQPFIRGGYSFDTVESKTARQQMRLPIEDTIYFAGEGLHEGIAPGTVEAALANGEETAKKIAAKS